MQKYTRTGTKGYLFYKDGVPVGTVRIYINPESKSGRVSALGVLPQYQGQGIAREALLEIERIHSDVKIWNLDTILQEAGNCHLYEKIGYKRTGKREEINEKIQELINDMLDTMYKANGVGLAAVQVGVLKQVVVIDIDDGNGPLVLINPKILKEKGEQEVEEGCLSFPNKFAKVIRPYEVTVEALDRDGKNIRVKAKELMAQALSHEIDHLNGTVFVDKVLPGTLEYVEPNKNKK